MVPVILVLQATTSIVHASAATLEHNVKVYWHFEMWSDLEIHLL